jgi:hypothetical protein
MPITRQDVLGSLKSTTNDLFYAVFGYIGSIATVRGLYQEKGRPNPVDKFSSFPLGVQLNGSITRVL